MHVLTMPPPTTRLSAKDTPSRAQNSRLPAILALASVLVATLLIFWSYAKLSQTWDESAHIGTGMEWLSRGVYTLDPIDPPLPRVSTAVVPYLLGIRSFGNRNPWDEGNLILDAQGNAHLYRVLTAARLGILPYFLIAAFLTWRITRRWLGPWPAAMAVFLFSTCPPVLAHASLATTDMSFVAMFLFAIDMIWLAFQDPKPLRCALAGLGFGLACIAKLSAFPYLALCGFAFLVYMLWKKKRLPRIPAWAVFAVAAILTIWAGYHFSVGSLATDNIKSQQTVGHALAKLGPAGGPVAAVVNHLPAYQYFQGLRIAQRMKQFPPPGYLFGEVYYGGRWYFFLLMALLKTPIPFTLLVVPGFVLAIRRVAKLLNGFALVPLAGIVFPILVATMSHINLGVRHVLVVYPFFAMLAALTGLSLYRSFHRSHKIATTAVALLLGWQLVSCLRVAPDFLTYFIEPVAACGGYIAIDSDYDWGQDLFRLRDELHALNASQVWVAYSGSADLNSYDLPGWKKLEPGQQVTGWVAISETMARAHPDQYGWLTQYQPISAAGKTFRIYRVE
jgi:4-amino-4-deoxy-L-arabinose transferase-like glycosyltransferase